MKVYKAQKRWPKVLLTIVVVGLVGVAGWYGWQWYEQDQKAKEAARQAEEERQQQEAQPQKSIEERFVERYYEVSLPGAERITEPPEITGNTAADSHIQQLAEDKGYRLQYTPTRPLQDINGEKLQPEAIKAWENIQQAARNDGIYIGLVSGYRSVQTQRVIFDSQLRKRADEEQGRPYTADQITSGKADAVINAVLREYSIPGYSKHHSGYTIDINDTAANRPFDEFGETEAFEWLSKNDYAKARQFGFLPSYPEGVEKLGPEAELWEYVWVGTENTEFEN